jgi:hypothetical protein
LTAGVPPTIAVAASLERSQEPAMPNPAFSAPLLVAVVLIVYGRVNRRTRWGNWIAVAGYALLAVTAVFALVARGVLG